MHLKFDPHNLYPLLESIEGTYEVAKLHSEAVDRHLGFEIKAVEEKLNAVTRASERHHWIGLPPSTLLTPYSEIRFMLSKLDLKPGEKVVDLGAGFGRMGFVIEAHFQGVIYEGYEVVSERVLEGVRVLEKNRCSHARLYCIDLLRSDGLLPMADHYFLYDLSHDLRSTDLILEKLKVHAQTHPISIVGRGRATRTTIERHHPWLSQVNDPKHFGNFSIYHS